MVSLARNGLTYEVNTKYIHVRTLYFPVDFNLVT